MNDETAIHSTLPVLHKLGSTKEDLLRCRSDMLWALRNVLERAHDMNPLLRDYPSRDAYEIANAIHGERIETIERLIKEINVEGLAIKTMEITQ